MKVYTVAQLIRMLEGFRGDLELQTLRDYVGYEDGVTVEPDVCEDQVILKFS